MVWDSPALSVETRIGASDGGGVRMTRTRMRPGWLLSAATRRVPASPGAVAVEAVTSTTPSSAVVALSPLADSSSKSADHVEPRDLRRVGRPDVAQRADVDAHRLGLRHLDGVLGAAQDRPRLADLHGHGQDRLDAVGVVDRDAGGDLEDHRAGAGVRRGGGDPEAAVVDDGGVDAWCAGEAHIRLFSVK